MKSINFKKSKKWILLIVVAAILLWTFVPMIICDVVVGGYGISGSSEYFSFGVYEYYIANSAIGFKKKIHKPYISIDGRDIPNYYTKASYIDTQSPEIRELYTDISDNHDPLIMDGVYTIVKLYEYVYYIREKDGNNFYKLSLDDYRITQIPYSKYPEISDKNIRLDIISLLDYYDGLYECMMEHIEKNYILYYMNTISVINGRVFFSSKHNKKTSVIYLPDESNDIKENDSFMNSEDLVISVDNYGSSYDIYEYNVDNKTAKTIVKINDSKYGYPTVIAVK